MESNIVVTRRAMNVSFWSTCSRCIDIPVRSDQHTTGLFRVIPREKVVFRTMHDNVEQRAPCPYPNSWELALAVQHRWDHQTTANAFVKASIALLKLCNYF